MAINKNKRIGNKIKIYNAWAKEGKDIENITDNESSYHDTISNFFNSESAKLEDLINVHENIRQASQSYTKLCELNADDSHLNKRHGKVTNAARAVARLSHHFNNSFDNYSDISKAKINLLTDKILKEPNADKSEIFQEIFAQAKSYSRTVESIETVGIPELERVVDYFSLDLAELSNLVEEDNNKIVNEYKAVKDNSSLNLVKSKIDNITTKINTKKENLKEKYFLESHFLKFFSPWKRYKLLDLEFAPELNSLGKEIAVVESDLTKYLGIKSQLKLATKEIKQKLSELKKVSDSLDVSYLQSLSGYKQIPNIETSNNITFIADEINDYEQSKQSLTATLDKKAITATWMLYSKVKEHFYSGILNDSTTEEKKRKLLLVDDLSTKMQLIDHDVAHKVNSVLKSVTKKYRTNSFTSTENEKTKQWLESVSDYLMEKVSSNGNSKRVVSKTYQFDLEKNLDQYAQQNSLPDDENLQLAHQLFSGSINGEKTLEPYSERIAKLENVQLNDLSEEDKDYLNEVLVAGIKNDYNHGYLGYFCKHKDRNAGSVLENFLLKAQSVV